jgi:hypothetical protein
MNKNGIVLSILAVILAGFYVYFFTDFFVKEYIEIIPQIRPNMRTGGGRRGGGPQVDQNQAGTYPVSFLLRGKWRLTTIKVVSADDMKTNKYPTPVWHMISDSNSIPTKAFYYGERIRGMKSAVPRAHPEALQPDVPYVLIVEAGKVKGQTNFHTREIVQATQ